MNLPLSVWGVHFRSIEAGRGIAALLVVLFHADKVMSNPAYWHARMFGGFFVAGHAGVEFFFVLSGFIIAHAHARDIGRPDRLTRYATRRFFRIYPLYWLVLSGIVALTLFGPDVPSLRQVDATDIASSYLLAGPDNHRAVLIVSWSLFQEVLFYFAFAVLITNRRAGVVVCAAWLALIATGLTRGSGALGLPVFVGLPAYVASPLNLLFALGVLVRLAVNYRRVRRPLAWSVVGVFAFVALGLEEALAPVISETLRDLLYGVASAVALAGIVSYERDHHLALPSFLSLLGAASYSIYLIHYPALSIVAKLMARFEMTSALPPLVGFVMLTAVVVLLGIATHISVERPMRAWAAR